MTELQVGERAPNFSAPATGPNPLVLSDLLSSNVVIMAFYPKAFTGG